MKKDNEVGGKNTSSLTQVTKEAFITAIINDVKANESTVRQGAKS